jgi:hypothetical protein
LKRNPIIAVGIVPMKIRWNNFTPSISLAFLLKMKGIPFKISNISFQKTKTIAMRVPAWRTASRRRTFFFIEKKC